MKKNAKSPKKQKTSAHGSSQKAIPPLEDPLISDDSPVDAALGVDQFTVVTREDEATSTGHRVEPIEEDDEHNAEKLVEEGLHGYIRAAPKKPHSPR
jgi:hypothetical protein